MPLLTKMTSHFRQGNGCPESQPKAIYHEDEYVPAYQHRYYVSKKYVDYSDEDLDYPLRDEFSGTRHGRNNDKDFNEDSDAMYRRSREKFASWAIRDLSPRTNGEVERASRNNKVYENFGSLKKKNEKNAGLNKGIRAIVEKLKLKSDDKKDSYKSKSKEVVDDEWRYDNGYKERKSPAKDGKTEKNQQFREYKYEHESRSRLRSPEDGHKKNSRHRESDRSKRRSYAFEVSPEDFDVRIERYERAPIDAEVHRRSSFSDKRRSASKDRRYKDCESSRRRSSSRDRNGSDDSFRRDRNGSDDSFREERNGRYEESSSSRRRRSVSRDRDRRLYKESDSPRRSLSRDRDVVDRKNSFRRYNKESESPRRSSSSSPKNNAKVNELSSKGKPPKSKISDRHSRPLTPPRDAVVMHCRESSMIDTPRKKEFSMREWYETNRRFASKYLKENSKAKELATSDANDQFVFELPEEARTLYEIESNIRRHSIDEASETKNSLPGTGYVGKIIREEEERGIGGHRRRYEEDAEEMENRRSYTTPSRKIWNYRDGV